MFFSALTQILRSAWLLLCHMTGRSGGFPPPLTAQEERALCERIAGGDETARGELVEHNLRLVAHIAKKYSGGAIEQDDLVSIGAIGLIKAVASFRPESGRLVTYAARCIENEMLMALRAGKKYRSNVSLDQPIGADSDGNEVRLMDILGTDPEAVPDSVALRLMSSRAVQVMDQVLTPREQKVICLRYGLLDGECRPQHEVAAQVGLSRSYVSRVEKSALGKLRRALGE